MEMEFELIGIDAPLANAFRRILIAEVRASDDSRLMHVGPYHGHRESFYIRQHICYTR